MHGGRETPRKQSECQTVRASKDRINRDIRACFELDEDYCKPVKVGVFWRNNYIEHKINGYNNKNLSVRGYLDKIKSYLNDIINDLQRSDKEKIKLIIAIKFISSKNNDEEHDMHSKGDNIDIMAYDKTDEAIEDFLS